MIKKLFKKLTERVPEGFPNAATWQLFENIHQNDDVNALKTCINAGADINFQDLDGNTPLIHCSKEGRYASARCLLEHGAGPSYINRDRLSALMHAVQRSDRTMAALLFEYDANAFNLTPGLPSPFAVSKDPEFNQWLRENYQAGQKLKADPAAAQHPVPLMKRLKLKGN